MDRDLGVAGGNLSIDNSGSVSGIDTNADNSAGYGIFARAAGNIGIVNTGSISSSGSGYNGNFGIDAVGDNLTIDNGGAHDGFRFRLLWCDGNPWKQFQWNRRDYELLSISSSGAYNAFAISTLGQLGATVTNSGSLTVLHRLIMPTVFPRRPIRGL